MIKRQIAAVGLLFCLLLNFSVVFAEDTDSGTGFSLVGAREVPDLGGTMYYYSHDKTGAQVIYLDNGAERRDFSIGFQTPPADSKGANHVLEHSLLCGSEKYPTKNIMHYVRANALAESINATTSDDCTYYEIKTPSETEYYNLIDVYLNGIFHPLLLTDENIFKQQGIRLEYADGQVRYNGVVYNELRLNSLDSTENSVNFLSDSLYDALYGDTAPAFDSGGSIEDLKNLTYEDVLKVYHDYYVPSNSMTYLAGKQDIQKTLTVLDSFFRDFEREDIPIRFADTKQVPEERVSEYNVTPDTKTVDIGFMSSGVPMWESAEELYARDIIYNLLSEKMQSLNDMNYTSGGNTGGISNLALLVSQVPVGKKDEIIAAYDDTLQQLSQEGFQGMDEAIDSYISQRQNPYLYAVELGVFNGILYHNDPFYFTEIEKTADRLRENPEIFEKAFKKYFTENPCSKVVISGNNGVSPEEEPPAFSNEEIEAIRRETESFLQWADEPDDPAVVASIPSLGLDEVQDPPQYAEPIRETAGNIVFYYTEKQAESAVLDLFFPVKASQEDLGYLQLLTAFIISQASKTGLDCAYIDLACMEDFNDTQTIHPQISISISGTEETISENFQKTMEILLGEELWNQSDLSAYLAKAPEEILKNGYRDPYYLSYEMKQSSQSAGNSFYAFTRGSIGQGSVPYYHFLNRINTGNSASVLEKLKQMFQEMVLDTAPNVEYVGGSGYQSLKQAVCAQFENAKMAEPAALALPVGWNSAATITELEDANHFMISGNIADSGYTYSGKMNILGYVLNANYLLPAMRGKYGAYGANVMFDQTGMTSAVAGLSDIDLAIEVWKGMGDYLRGLEITQKELDAVIVPAVKEFDTYYNDSEYGAIMALCGKTADDIQRVREEMLSTTVEDLRAYADFVDAMVAQENVFAVLGKAAADSSAFDFGYYANAGTLEISPRLTKYPGSYISGKSETEFAPDDLLTRAEAAQLIARLMADQRGAEGDSPYFDVARGAWYYSAVVSLSEKGVLAGYSDGSFRPDSPITRGELASVLSNFLYGIAEGTGTAYPDLSQDDWFYPAVIRLTGQGILTGYEDGTLRPENPITRAEAVTVINRMVGKTAVEPAESAFRDTQGHWAAGEIAAAAN